MKPHNLAKLMALGLKPEALAVVLSIFTEEVAPLEKRRVYDRKRKATAPEAPASANGHAVKGVEIKVDTPQWRAWEKYRGKSLPCGRAGVWIVESEWPPNHQGA
jgi:hypothetical protein